ncbi:hypothetical protein DY023_12120 [Microbacterium bovistercoris]|uniref:Ig-like domain-containing protein n=1 Tax=Microbacterium bovistercoris TaxID=2293570 RepID=A0A371NS06_9MICO|nr:PxKF domain-containing protein [Microbacterium bovistercoris]REJ04987.1 hypothetical protein DY023_12120 [Microbacterium bovistercoris]
MARGWGGIGAALVAVAVTAGLLCAPASAEQIDWRPGPVTARVLFDTAPATEGIAEGDVDGVDYTRAVCFTPDPVSGAWDGEGVTVTVDAADTDMLSCTVRATVRYCSWELWRRTCDGVRAVELRAEGEPLHVDSTTPRVTGAHVVGSPSNAEGWFRAAGTVVWSGRDRDSGIESCTTAPMAGADTVRSTVVGLCRDRSGNASETFTYTYRLDTTPPTLQPTVSGTAELGAPAGAHPGASDETSGVAAAVCNGGAPLDTSSTGQHTVVCSAVDVAGNSASAATTYSVGYGFAGAWFRQADDPSRRGVRHPVRAGSSTAFTFRATTDSAGTPAEHLDAARVTVRVAPMPCAFAADSGAVPTGALVSSGLRDLGGGRYLVVWSSPRAWAGACGLLTLDLGDGLPHHAAVAFLQ